MVFRYEGKIIFSDNTKININVNPEGKITYSFDGAMPDEPVEFLRLMTDAIEANLRLLKGCSPKKVVMEEIEV